MGEDANHPEENPNMTQELGKFEDGSHGMKSTVQKCKVMHLATVKKNFLSPKRSLFRRTEGLLSVLQ